MYKMIVAALPIAVSHDYRSRAAHLRIRAVDAEPGRVRLGIDLILGRGEAIRVALKAVMPAQAGIQNRRIIWAPAFAGVTINGFSEPILFHQRSLLFCRSAGFFTSFVRGCSDQKNRSNIVVARWLSASENSPRHR